MTTATAYAMKQIHTSYQENQVFTASREELIFMLYDGALRFIRQGQEAQQKNDHAQAGYAILRAEKIVHYLSMSLNMQAGGDLSRNLAALYGFINRLLGDSLLKKDPLAADQAHDLILGLREAWQQAHLNGQPAVPGSHGREGFAG